MRSHPTIQKKSTVSTHNWSTWHLITYFLLLFLPSPIESTQTELSDSSAFALLDPLEIDYFIDVSQFGEFAEDSSEWLLAADEGDLDTFKNLVTQTPHREAIVHEHAYNLALAGNDEVLGLLNKFGVRAQDKFLFKLLDLIDDIVHRSIGTTRNLRAYLGAFNLLLKHGGNLYATEDGQSLFGKCITTRNAILLTSIVNFGYDFERYPQDYIEVLKLAELNYAGPVMVALNSMNLMQQSAVKNFLHPFLDILKAKFVFETTNDSLFLQHLVLSDLAANFRETLKKHYPDLHSELMTFKNNYYYRHSKKFITEYSTTLLSSIFLLWSILKIAPKFKKKTAKIRPDSLPEQKLIPEKNSVTRNDNYSYSSDEDDAETLNLLIDLRKTKFQETKVLTEVAAKKSVKINYANPEEALPTNLKQFPKKITQKKVKLIPTIQTIKKEQIKTPSLPAELKSTIHPNMTFAQVLEGKIPQYPKTQAEIEIPDEAYRILSLLTDSALPNAEKTFVVGGYPRDAVLKREVKSADVDIVTGINLTPVLGKLFLNENMTIWDNGKFLQIMTASGLHIDIWYSQTLANNHPTIQAAIDADSKTRDFNCNTLYAYKKGSEKKLHVVEPCEGIYEDVLKSDNIDTVIDPEISLPQDPIRILRAYIYSNKLERKLSNRLSTAISTHKNLLLSKLDVSADNNEAQAKRYGDRLNATIAKILISENANAIFADMKADGVLQLLFPPEVIEQLETQYVYVPELINQVKNNEIKPEHLIMNLLLRTLPIYFVENLRHTLSLMTNPEQRLQQIDLQLSNLERQVRAIAEKGYFAKCLGNNFAKCLGNNFSKVFKQTLTHLDYTKVLVNEKNKLLEKGVTHPKETAAQSAQKFGFFKNKNKKKSAKKIINNQTISKNP